MVEGMSGIDGPDAVRADAGTPRRRPDRALRAAALVLLGVAAVALVYNLVTTLRTLDRYPGSRFGEVFLATDGDDLVATLWFSTIVWAPVVLPLLAAALLLVSFLPALRRHRPAHR